MIRLSRVTYNYADNLLPAIYELDLEIAPGEFLAIMGRNASGKSTLARLLNGLFCFLLFYALQNAALFIPFRF
jgi:ABC-type bacteriocin/lantibiotic exporter with double-glycine peptidase domain